VTAFDKQAVAEKLAGISLTPANRLFMDYWLSRHTEDGRPCESDLPAEAIVRARRFTVTGEVKPGRSAVVVNTGPAIVNLLSYNLNGIDLIDVLAPALRPIRLERTAEIARGAIAHNRQLLITSHGEEFFLEEVIVPFGRLTYDGKRLCVTHVDFTPLADYPRKLIEKPDRPAVDCRYLDVGFKDAPRWA
jgi:hypothetical protein